MPDFQVAHQLARRDRLIEAFEQFGGAFFLLRLINRRDAFLQFAAEENVLRDAQIFKQVQLLMHHADPVGGGIARVSKLHRLAVELHLAKARLLYASEDLHQR